MDTNFEMEDKVTVNCEDSATSTCKTRIRFCSQTVVCPTQHTVTCSIVCEQTAAPSHILLSAAHWSFMMERPHVVGVRIDTDSTVW